MSLKESRITRILVTGAGGPAAIAILRSLMGDVTIELLAADMDPWAAGLFMVNPGRSLIVPRADHPDFLNDVLSTCSDMDVDILFPTVDAELDVISQNLARFHAAGVRVVVPEPAVLANVLDKFELAKRSTWAVRVPRTELLSRVDVTKWEYPVIVKPRRGAGSRDISLVTSAKELSDMEPSDDFIVQEFLPGEEYSIDVLATSDERVVAAVPRVRQRVDSGVSVAGYTLRDAELEEFARRVVTELHIPWISNVQVRRDRNGLPSLLEINPRVPGTLALSVAAGVDMVRYVVEALRGHAMPDRLEHREVAMVRYLEERVVDLDMQGHFDTKAGEDA